MQRYYFLDAMRSILMMLGVVLHSAVVFSNNSWLLPEQESQFYSQIVHIIHLFRMPAFFIISGFFCHLMLGRTGNLIFIKQKISRILLPLVATAITLNSLQNILLNDYRSENMDLLSSGYWLQGSWVSHLWFLISLIYFLIISTAIKSIAPKLANTLLSNTVLFFTTSRSFLLIILALLSLVLIKLSNIASLHIMNSEFNWEIAESIKYSIYFYFGIIIARSPEILERFTRFKLTMLLLPSLVILALVNIEITGSIWQDRIQLIINTLLTWSLCYICFILFHKLTNIPSKLFLYLSDASYTIYLFHHILVIAFSILLHPVDIPNSMKFITVIGITFATTIVIHNYIICKFPIMSLLYNGKHPKRYKKMN